ncbi:hypothetical protein ACFQFC_32680 [Amorphoplanes digitatis]|uniref:Uncharacterized protein n=1 Tax=Actinoplanes digitatis TaxID=1868 RepID=A0A7W7MND7_9ACTN|nr:hypothetical protein [Actinoplanes digitatis]MBB4760913.1 hypothetical protein [Actinoplanes digitatis]GID95105.1 hypothetical protein Adi01nite_45170 [Actinoplanes digitatis]
MHDPVDGPPFRWELVGPDELGTMLDGTGEPSLWFMPDLVRCAGRVLARSGDGDLFFVGRSLDSMFDLLSGALADLPAPNRVARAPFSFQRRVVPVRRSKWRRAPLSAEERAAARRLLGGLGITPHALARRARPAVFVDVVDAGGTFTELFTLLDEWIVESREPWEVIRKKLRFVGVTVRRPSSPKTWRWQQHEPWTRRLPARAVLNVSLDPWVWSYFGNHQTKLTRSFRPGDWLAAAEGPRRDEQTRQALAEAVAVVAYGRSGDGRRALARAVHGEPALAQPWLRSLVSQLNKL